MTGGHTVRFYKDEKRLYEDAGAFLRAGIVAGEGAIVIATPEHLAGFEAILAADLDVLALKLRGQLVCMDAETTLGLFMDGNIDTGMPEAVGFKKFVDEVVGALLLHYPKVRAYGEMIHLLSRRGNQ